MTASRGTRSAGTTSHSARQAVPAARDARCGHPVDDVVPGLGAAIRARRHRLGLTLVEVAHRTGLSHPFLSQVERGLARPSMRSLTALATALRTTAQALLALPAPDAAISLVRHAAPLPVVDSPGGTVRSLVHGERAMLPVEFDGAPAEFEEYFRHDGDEFLYVVAGALEVDVEGEHHRLGTGDSLYYPGGLEHRWRRLGERPVRLVVVQHNVGPATATTP